VILGLDLFVDEDMKTYLLEVNNHPSMNIYLEKEHMGGNEGRIVSLIDHYVKKRILGDTILLVKKKKEKIKQIDEFRSLSKIFPTDDSESNFVVQNLKRLRDLFYKIAPIKNKAAITSSNFCKINSVLPLCTLN